MTFVTFPWNHLYSDNVLVHLKERGCYRVIFFVIILQGCCPALGQRKRYHDCLPTMLPATALQDILLSSVFIHWSFHGLNVLYIQVLFNTMSIWPPLVERFGSCWHLSLNFLFHYVIYIDPVPRSWTKLPALPNHSANWIWLWVTPSPGKSPTYTLSPLFPWSSEANERNTLSAPTLLYSIYWQRATHLV